MSVARFVADVEFVAQRLPARTYLINACQDRYRFTVGLAAALLRSQVCLLPPTQSEGMLQALRRDYPDLYTLSDVPPVQSVVDVFAFPLSPNGLSTSSPVPAFVEGQVAAIAFTSGSTGRPTPHAKTWGAMAKGAQAEAQQLGLAGETDLTLVGTVPPQHMYGLESTVLMALRNGLALHGSRPFYPADVRAALEEIASARVLVTTPVHLRALLEDRTPLPKLKQIVCATAPLAPEMARRAEQFFNAPLYEVYGFTEAGMVATRRTTQSEAWFTLPAVECRRDAEQRAWVRGGHIENDVLFSDLVDIVDNRTFLLRGRNADMVNVAGKRTSIAYLNHELTAIEGVLDGVFLLPDTGQEAVTRLTAIVVAPGMTHAQVLNALRPRIDAAFLPRPLFLVDALPRNATGKLPREALLALAEQCTAARDGTEVKRKFPPDDPAANGHFPGNPLIPGALLLDEVIDAAVTLFRMGPAAVSIKSAKFISPVRPGDSMHIRFEEKPGGDIGFECQVGDAVAARGSLSIGRPAQKEAT
ncbi:MAG: AMP-binding protein [Burkholderiales bacterium]